MKKILFAAILMAFATAAVAVNPTQLRSFGDQGNDGFSWSIADVFPPGDPACLGNTTVQGAAYIGTIDTGQFGASDPVAAEHAYIRGNGLAMMVFDACELVAEMDANPGSKLQLQIRAGENYGLSFTPTVSLIDFDTAERTLAGANGTGAGPFGAGFTGGHQAAMAAQGNHGFQVVASANRMVRFQETTYDLNVDLTDGGSGGTLDVCLSPTGKVRIIDSGNNGDWAIECVAGGYRPATISLGGAGGIANAARAACDAGLSIETCDYSCTPGLYTDRCVPGSERTLTNPLVLGVAAGGEQVDRWGQRSAINGGIFPSFNAMCLGGSPLDCPGATIEINAVP